MDSYELDQVKSQSRNFPDHKQRLDLRNAYHVDSIKKAREMYMGDLIASKSNDTDHTNYKHINQIRDEVIEEFMNETGLCKRVSETYYIRVSRDAMSKIPIAHVLTQCLNYGLKILADAKNNVDSATRGSSEMSQAINAYTAALKNVNDTMLKLEANDINRDKNAVNRERTAADSALGAAEIAMNLEGSLDDKRTTIKNALENSKALRDVVNQLKKKRADNDDDDIGVDLEEFKGVQVEEDDGS